MKKKGFDEYVREYRAFGRIPKVWSVSDLRPLMKDLFSANTIGVFPHNYSCSPDGEAKGNAILRGMAPKYLRMGTGRFILINEYGNHESLALSDLTKPQQPNCLHQADEASDRGNLEGQIVPRRPVRGRLELIERKFALAFPSRQSIFEFADYCAREYRAFSDSYYLYRYLISRQSEATIDALIADPDFLGLIHRTLISWDMNYRNARLVSRAELSSRVRQLSNKLRDLSRWSLDDLDDQAARDLTVQLDGIFRELRVMESASQIVGVSKTLHFLLPRLVPPIDGRYTLKFLFGYRVYPRAIDGDVRLFSDIFRGFLGLIRRLKLSQADVNDIGWNTNLPKIVDNAIIGYVKMSGSTARSKENE